MSDISHRTIITLDTGDSLTTIEKELIEMKLRWLCQIQLIPLTKLTVETEKIE